MKILSTSVVGKILRCWEQGKGSVFHCPPITYCESKGKFSSLLEKWWGKNTWFQYKPMFFGSLASPVWWKWSLGWPLLLWNRYVSPVWTWFKTQEALNGELLFFLTGTTRDGFAAFLQGHSIDTAAGGGGCAAALPLHAPGFGLRNHERTR